MGFMANIKGRQAYTQHGKGNYAEALRMYEEAYKAGMDDPKLLLAWSSLLVRSAEYQKARDLLVKIQKAPGMTPEQKMQLFCNYAACVYQMGEIDKGIAILERQHAKAPTGLVYETLGYLYVVRCEQKPTDEEQQAALERIAEAEAAAKEAAEAAPEEGETETAPAPVPAEPEKTPMEKWEALKEKAKAFLDEAVDYDDEDAICLDNLAQYFYRVLGDKAAAKTLFDKAIAIKETQIDTLWFLSRYDVESGDTARAIERLKKAAQGRFSPLNYANRDMIREELARLGAALED